MTPALKSHAQITPIINFLIGGARGNETQNIHPSGHSGHRCLEKEGEVIFSKRSGN